MLSIGLYELDTEEVINIILDGNDAIITERVKREKISGLTEVSVGKAFRAGGKLWRWNGDGLDYMGDI